MDFIEYFFLGLAYFAVIGFLVSGVDDLFFDTTRDRLYATCGEGSLAVLERGDGGRFAVAEKIPTRKLARTCLFDPASGRLFVILPRTDARTPPELRVYRPVD